jgi:hypothetical protein
MTSASSVITVAHPTSIPSHQQPQPTHHIATIDTLPPALAKTLQRTPMAGERNVWLMQVASRAKHVASAQRVRAFLHQVAAQHAWHDRDFSHEIDRAIARAYGMAPSVRQRSVVTAPSAAKPHTAAKRPTWPEFSPEDSQLYAQHELLFELRAKPFTPADVLDQIYTQDELLCLARDVRSASTMPRHHWRGMEPAMQFIVANPMTATIGRTLDGKLSPRCLEIATQSRRFQVVEFDRGSPQQQAAILSSLHTPATVPLIMVLWSGGKSMHGWFDVRAFSETAKQDFFAWAVTLGADASLWDPCKLVRMPGGRRSNGKAQPILHFNPKHLLT